MKKSEALHLFFLRISLGSQHRNVSPTKFLLHWQPFKKIQSTISKELLHYTLLFRRPRTVNNFVSEPYQNIPDPKNNAKYFSLPLSFK